MRLIQKQNFFCICLIFLMSALFAPNVSAAGQAENAPAEIPKPSHYLVATYFHNTFRCPTCHKIEELSADAIRSNFSEALKNGTLVWRVINVDEPGNQHYNKDYQLYTKSLIISEVKDGKEIRWKNLEKVWTFVRDDQKFEQYVTSEIHDWLKE